MGQALCEMYEEFTVKSASEFLSVKNICQNLSTEKHWKLPDISLKGISKYTVISILLNSVNPVTPNLPLIYKIISLD